MLNLVFTKLYLVFLEDAVYIGGHQLILECSVLFFLGCPCSFMKAFSYFLPIFLFDGMDHHWTWRRWSLNSNQLSWTLFPLKALSCGTLSVRFLKTLVCSLEVQDCEFALPYTDFLDCNISWSLWAGLPSTATPKTSPFFFFFLLPQSRCRILHLTLLNFMRLSWAHLSILSRFLWMASVPSITSFFLDLYLYPLTVYFHVLEFFSLYCLN